MNTETTRAKILEAGARLVHRKGFNHTGLKEILEECNVPKGSFYFYFKSKEDFGLAIVDYYMEGITTVATSCFEDESKAPIERLHSFFLWFYNRFEADGCEKGCPIGNLCQEMSDLSPAFREKLKSVTEQLSEAVSKILTQAKKTGDLPDHLDTEETAAFITSSWQGAVLTMKVTKSLKPLDRFDQFIFRKILSSQRLDGF